MHRVLLVDDKETMVSFLGTVLKRYGFEVVPAYNGQQALDLFEPGAFEVVVSDLRMEPVNGIELLKALREKQNDLLFILITAYGEINAAVEALKYGVFDCLIKPFDVGDLLTTIRRGLAYKQALTGALDLRMLVGSCYRMGDIVAESESMREVCRTIQHLAPLDVSVLISGEKGTGKALIARTIHDYSSRRDLPFIDIACSVLRNSLGSAPGDGNDRARRRGERSALSGLLDGGTLFLDSLEEIPPDVQKELLRELRQIVPADAATSERHALPRIISSTTVDLKELVSKGGFDSQLYRALCGADMFVSPLRERSEDILPMVYHFANREMGSTGTLPCLGTAACAVMDHYSWPGNAAELENCVKFALNNAEDGRIASEALPADILQAAGPGADEIDLKTEFFHAAFLKQFLKSEQSQVAQTIREKAERYRKEQKLRELEERKKDET